MGNVLENFTVNSYEILVINLDNRPDRLKYINGVLKSKMLAYRRVSAVNGKKYNSIPEICSSENYKDLICIGSDDRTDKLPHTGCYLSHLKCLKLASNSVFNKTMILEDDAKFISDDFKNIIEDIVQNNKEVDIIWLNASKTETNVVEKYFMPTWGTQGYLVNKKAAILLYKLLKPGNEWINSMDNCLIDFVLPFAVKELKLNWKVISLVTQTDVYKSDIKELITQG